MRSPAARSAVMAYGLQIILACASASSETSIPRTSATTRMNMKTLSGMVSILTIRISGGMSASSGDRCASSMSILVSKRMYAHFMAKSSDAFCKLTPRFLISESAASRSSAASARMILASESRVSVSSSLVCPKSITDRVLPSGPTSKLPGCGSL